MSKVATHFFPCLHHSSIISLLDMFDEGLDKAIIGGSNSAWCNWPDWLSVPQKYCTDKTQHWMHQYRAPHARPTRWRFQHRSYFPRLDICATLMSCAYGQQQWELWHRSDRSRRQWRVPSWHESPSWRQKRTVKKFPQFAWFLAYITPCICVEVQVPQRITAFQIICTYYPWIGLYPPLVSPL